MVRLLWVFLFFVVPLLALSWLLPPVLRRVVSVVASGHPMLSAFPLSPSAPLLLWHQVLLSSVLVPLLVAQFLIPGS